MAYKVIILYQLYMPSYFLGTFTEYPWFRQSARHSSVNRRLALSFSGFARKWTYDSLFLHQSEDFTDPQYQRSQTDNDPPVFPT